MKKSLLSLLIVTATCSGFVQAQTRQKAASVGGHKIGLIDFGKIMKGYDKVAAAQLTIKGEIERMQAELNGKVDRLNKLRTDSKRFEVGGPQYEQAEKAILEAQGDIKAFSTSVQLKAARRESELLRDIYTDVTVAVGHYADFAQLDCVMKFNSQKAEDAKSPKETMNVLSGNFMYWKPERDITNTILNHLNQEYKSAGSGTRSQSVSGRTSNRPTTTRPRQ